MPLGKWHRETCSVQAHRKPPFLKTRFLKAPPANATRHGVYAPHGLPSLPRHRPAQAGGTWTRASPRPPVRGVLAEHGTAPGEATSQRESLGGRWTPVESRGPGEVRPHSHSHVGVPSPALLPFPSSPSRPPVCDSQRRWRRPSPAEHRLRPLPAIFVVFLVICGRSSCMKAMNGFTCCVRHKYMFPFAVCHSVSVHGTFSYAGVFAAKCVHLISGSLREQPPCLSSRGTLHSRRDFL